MKSENEDKKHPKAEQFSSPRKHAGKKAYKVEQTLEELNAQKPKYVVENNRYNNPLLTRPIESVMEVNEDKSISSSQENRDGVSN